MTDENQKDSISVEKEKNTKVNNNHQKSRKQKAERVIAMIALFVSVGSVAISIWTGNEAAKTNRINLMPLLSMYSDWNYSTDTNEGKADSERHCLLTWGIENKGLGPAVIYDARYFHSNSKKGYKVNKPIIGMKLKKILSNHFDEIEIGEQDYDFNYLSPGYTLHPKDSTLLFGVAVPASSIRTSEGQPSALRKIIFSVCYCSLQGDCYSADTRNIDDDKISLMCPEKVDMDCFIKNVQKRNSTKKCER